MEHIITHVDPNSVAEEVGFRAGDVLLGINGEPVIDEIDYQDLTSRDRLVIAIRRGSEELEYEFSKDDAEPLGLHFGESMILKPRPCHNHCVFCFIAQMPPNMRPSLYVKDDDWRFSLMMGNFITLTNVSDEEFERIIKRRASPLYISVHTTHPELRCKMMNHPHAGDLMDKLRKLKAAGIRFHCQIVAVPGWNDGEELDRTLQDLKSLYPAARSVAIVPVGLTKFRQNLPELAGFEAESALRLLNQVKVFQEQCKKELGTSFAFCSDEFYTLSGQELPPEEWYEEYPQIENGVGLIRRLITEMEEAQSMDRAWGVVEPKVKKRYWIPTGVSFAETLKKLVKRFAPKNTQIEVLPVVNHFFGEKVTVTGLLTAQDLLAALQAQPLKPCDEILLCASVLRHERDLFLDGVTYEDFLKALPCPVHLLDNDGSALYEAFFQRFDE